MHEFALADAVAKAAARIAGREGLTKVTRIRLRIGELQRIRSELFTFAMREVLAKEEGPLEEARIDIESVPARLRCRACGRAFAPDECGGAGGAEAQEAIHFVPELAHAFLACPGCGSPDFEIVEGRGVVLERIEGDR